MLKNLLRKNNPNPPDYFLLGIVIALLFSGILILASVSAPYALREFGNTYHFLKHQIFFGLLPGLVLGFIAFRVNLSFVMKNAHIFFLAAFFLMVAVFLPIIGSASASAPRWINIAGYSFQPSELLKIALILYLASWISSYQKNIYFKKSIKGFIFPLAAFLIVLFLIMVLFYFQSDISTLAIIIAVAAIMYFSANTPFWHILAIMGLGAAVLMLLIKVAAYRTDRVLVFLNPETDPMGIGYQTKQAIIAIGSGGIGGVGLGMSIQKLGILPQTVSDSIFAIFSEETGFIGSAFIIILLLLFAWRGFKTAKNAPDSFCSLAAIGITSWIIIQSFVNIGAMIGLLPLTGIPLPFISFGGSALVCELIAMGILLNISAQKNKL